MIGCTTRQLISYFGLIIIIIIIIIGVFKVFSFDVSKVTYLFHFIIKVTITITIIIRKLQSIFWWNTKNMTFLGILKY